MAHSALLPVCRRRAMPYMLLLPTFFHALLPTIYHHTAHLCLLLCFSSFLFIYYLLLLLSHCVPSCCFYFGEFCEHWTWIKELMAAHTTLRNVPGHPRRASLCNSPSNSILSIFCCWTCLPTVMVVARVTDYGVNLLLNVVDVFSCLTTRWNLQLPTPAHTWFGSIV